MVEEYRLLGSGPVLAHADRTDDRAALGVVPRLEADVVKMDNSFLRPGERVPRDHGVPAACFLILAIIAAIVLVRGLS
jgi:hypothetical protein